MARLRRSTSRQAQSALAAQQSSSRERRDGDAVSSPSWDPDERELRLGDVLIKRICRPAQCQEAILSAFQEDGWPQWIDDPLSPMPGKNSKVRLHDAINCLNRSHLIRGFRFRGDGTGTRVGWQWDQSASGR